MYLLKPFFRRKMSTAENVVDKRQSYRVRYFASLDKHNSRQISIISVLGKWKMTQQQSTNYERRVFWQR